MKETNMEEASSSCQAEDDDLETIKAIHKHYQREAAEALEAKDATAARAAQLVSVSSSSCKSDAAAGEKKEAKSILGAAVLPSLDKDDMQVTPPRQDSKYFSLENRDLPKERERECTIQISSLSKTCPLPGGASEDDVDKEFASKTTLTRATTSALSQPGAFAHAPTGFCEAPDEETRAEGRDVESQSLQASFTTATSLSPSASDARRASGLAVAILLEEEEDLDLPRAQEEQWEDTNLVVHKSLVGVAVFFAMVVLVALVVLLVILIPNKASDSSSSNTISTPPATDNSTTSTNQSKDYILALLPEYTTQTILNDQDTGSSPQAKALQWALEDPSLEAYLELNDQHRRFLQRFALATFYFAMQGDLWHYNAHWLSYDHHECLWFARNAFAFDQPDDQILYLRDYPDNPNPCEWDADNTTVGEQNKQKDDYYRHLWVHVNNLKGTLPREIFWLSSLRSVSLYSNDEMTGSIPTQIGYLTDLEGLVLAYSQLTGTVPTQIGNLEKLFLFALPSNQLTGTIPSQIGRISSLDSIIWDLNLFTGTIPDEVYDQTKIRTLYFQENHLTGTLSSHIGKLTNLWDFQMYDNQWHSGTIPIEIGLMTSLKRVILPRMNFTGPLCSELGLIANNQLVVLELLDNHLQGRIPSQLGMLSNTLHHLLLQDNDLSGVLPEELSSLGLWTWNVSGNPNLLASGEEADQLCWLNTSLLERENGICDLPTHLPVYCYCSQCSCPSTALDNSSAYAAQNRTVRRELKLKERHLG